MRLELTGRHVEITPELRALVEKRLAKLDRLLAGGIVSVQAVLTLEKYRRLAEFTVHMRGDRILHGLGRTNAWETSIADAIEKVTQQLVKVKGKWQARKRHGESVRLTVGQLSEARTRGGEPRARQVRRVTPYPLEPMTVDEAARALEAGDDAFLLFRNEASDDIAVVYRRKDGRLGLIEPER
jgi:putative sigma-54 modulation protein